MKIKKVRWGIAGAGNIANRFAQAIKNVDSAELVAVASRDSARGSAFAEKHGIQNVFCGYEALAKSELVDAVYVATPHSHHLQCAELFLNSGKHLLVEKPLCVNAKQAQRLKALSEKRGLFLMEALWTRFLPAIIEAQAVVTRGDIGEVLGIEADFCYNFPRGENRVYLNELAGGSLLDVGVYGLNFAAMFLGNSPESITAVANTDGNVDLHTNVILKYKSGAIATVSSAINLEKPATAYIYGSRGRIKIPDFYGASELFITTEKGEKQVHLPPVGNGFEEQIIEACRCIDESRTESKVMPLDESIAILKQMDVIRQQTGIVYPFAD